jgi:hypothetical protein
VTLINLKSTLGITLSLLTVISTSVDARLISRSAGTKDAGGDFGDKLIILNSSSVNSGKILPNTFAIVANLDGKQELKGGAAAVGCAEPEPFVLPDGAIDNGDGTITLSDGLSMDLPPPFDPDNDEYECGYEFFQNELVELLGSVPSFSNEFVTASYVWTITGSAGSLQNVYDPLVGGDPSQTTFSDFAFLQLGSYTINFDITLTINDEAISNGYNTLGYTQYQDGSNCINDDGSSCDIYDVGLKDGSFRASYSSFLNIVSRPAAAANDVSAPGGIILMLVGSLGVWLTRRKLKAE